MRLRMVHDVSKRLGTQAPGRGVHDSAQRELVAGVQGDAHVRNPVLDLFAIEKLGTSEDAVRDPGNAELLFEQLGLRVGSVEHRNFARIGPVPLELPDFGRHELRLFLGLGKNAEAHGRSALPDRLQDFGVRAFARLLDGRVGHVHDRDAGTIVLLQLGDHRAREVLLEVENVVDAGAAPSVDRLVVVADDTDVATVVGEQPNEIQLRDIGVLKLVDQHMSESGAPLAANAGPITKEYDGLDDQVIEIHRMHVREGRLVRPIDASCRLIVLVSLGTHLTGLQQCILPKRDPGQDRLCIELPICLRFGAQKLPYDAEAVTLIEDREARAQPQRLGLLAHEAHPKAVKRRQPNRSCRFVPHRCADAFAHLIGRLVGKGHRQDRAWLNSARKQPRDPGNDDTRLPRTCARQNQQRPLVVLYGRPLLCIQSQGCPK